MSRKRIGFVTAFPETPYVQRLLKGIIAQCRKYDYDLAVFCSLASVNSSQKNHLSGELNIYNLINFEKLDGVIVDSISLTDSNTSEIVPGVRSIFHQKCCCPVIAVGDAFEDYPVLYTNDGPVFEEATGHLTDVHGCRDFLFLSGPKGHPVSECRLEGFLKALSSRNIPLREDAIVYGDFWFTSGQILAEKLFSGVIQMPDAVVCASDHMAIGLVNRLTDNGVHVPRDVIVTGFDATPEAAINSVSITSFVPPCSETSANAVDMLRRMIEPDAEIQPFRISIKEHISIGESCGCDFNIQNMIDQFRDSLYNLNHSYGVGANRIDIGLLLESNMIEYLSSAASPQECISQICLFTYLLKPYDDFYLCLDKNWFDPDLCTATGYPEKSCIYLHTMIPEYAGPYKKDQEFDTKDMHPKLWNTDRPPSVFYFMPVHFLDQSMGYAVMRNDLDHTHKINCVVRNWMKDVDNALEICRTKYKLLTLSAKDGMTGVYNRRGMEIILERMLSKAKDTDNVLALVIDVDSLKYINDHFGHDDGDFTINAVCDAAAGLIHEEEICVRAGGDEFYVIGIGDYTPQDAEERMAEFDNLLAKCNRQTRKPYVISASIGSACVPLDSEKNIMNILKIADARMYENKVKKKIQRTN